MPKLYSIEDIRRLSETTGHYFFAPSTLRYFNSRCSEKVHPGGVFVTSERLDRTSPRLYTVRKIEEDGAIRTLGSFQQYRNSAAAHSAAAKYCEENGLKW